MISSINGIWMKLDTHISLATQSQSFANWPEGPQSTLKALSLSLLNLYADCAPLAGEPELPPKVKGYYQPTTRSICTSSVFPVQVLLLLTVMTWL